LAAGLRAGVLRGEGMVSPVTRRDIAAWDQ